MNQLLGEARTAPRRRNKVATREAILAAARTVLASDGPDGLSLSKVANLAGVNRGTAYQHFATREDLIKATVQWVSEHLSSTVFSELDDEGHLLDARHRLINEAIIGLVNFAVDNPELCRIWLFEVLASDNPAEDRFFKQFKTTTEDLANSEMSEDGIDAEALSVLMLAGYFLWPVWVHARARTKKERQELARRMQRELLRLFMHGVLRAEQFPELQTLLDS